MRCVQRAPCALGKQLWANSFGPNLRLGLPRRALLCAARTSSPPADAPSVDEAEQPKPKRKYTRRKSAAPAEATAEPDAAPPAADPPKRKGRARSKTTPLLSLPDSHLPWAGRANTVAQDGVVGSSRVTMEQQPDDDKPGAKRRPSARRLQRGTAAVEGDSLTKEMMEQTMKTDESGGRYVDRAIFGGGKPQWYSVGIVVGKEKKFKEAMEQRIAKAPLAMDESTGEMLPRAQIEVLIPTRKVTHKSESGRKTSRTQKYMDGGLVFIRCTLDNELIDFIQGTPYFRAWRDQLTWTYPGMGTVTLPQPASKEAMDSLNNWLHGEVAPEDLPQVDEEAAKMDPGAPADVNAQGEAIIQRDYAGSYTNPNAWFEGDVAEPPRRGRGRGRTPATTRPSRGSSRGPPEARHPAPHQQVPSPPPPPFPQQQQQFQQPQWLQPPLDPYQSSWAGSALDEEQSLQMADRFFSSRSAQQQQGGSSQGSKRSAREAPPYPDPGTDAMLGMDAYDDNALMDFDEAGFGLEDDLLEPPPRAGAPRGGQRPYGPPAGPPPSAPRAREPSYGGGSSFTGSTRVPPSQQPAGSGYLDDLEGGFGEQSGYLDQQGGQGLGMDMGLGDDDLFGPDFMDEYDTSFMDMSDEDILGLSGPDGFGNTGGAPPAPQNWETAPPPPAGGYSAPRQQQQQKGGGGYYQGNQQQGGQRGGGRFDSRQRGRGDYGGRKPSFQGRGGRSGGGRFGGGRGAPRGRY